MKKILSVIFLISLLFASCSKLESAKNDLNGDWVVQTFNAGPISFSFNDVDSVVDYTVPPVIPSDYEMIFSFN